MKDTKQKVTNKMTKKNRTVNKKGLDYNIIHNFGDFTHEITEATLHMWAASKPLKEAIRLAIKAKFITQEDANMMIKMYKRRSDEITSFMIALRKPLYEHYKVEAEGEK